MQLDCSKTKMCSAENGFNERDGGWLRGRGKVGLGTTVGVLKVSMKRTLLNPQRNGKWSHDIGSLYNSEALKNKKNMPGRE